MRVSNIIAVVPVDPNERNGLEYKPGPTMIHTLCEVCEIECWVGPNQMGMKQKQPELPILCTNCLVVQLQKWKAEDENVSTVLKSLEDDWSIK